jgi:HTH DNA binding domain
MCPSRPRRGSTQRRTSYRAPARRGPAERKRPSSASRSATPATTDAAEGYSVYRVDAPLSQDGWGFHFTRAHPSLRLEILDRLEIGGGYLLAEVRMMGPGAYDWPMESRRFPQVTHIETHPEGPTSVLYRITYRAPFIHAITRKHGVLTRYPIIIQNGRSQFETFAAPRQMQGYLKELTEEVGPSQVGSVQQGSVTTQTLGLTPGQVAIFQEAVTAGFFQVPRLVTLTRLAERLGRSKSTISTALVKIRKRLAESALQVDLSAFNTDL